MTGIYVHIPYCARRCIYCDFYTEGVRRADWPRYVSALLNELRWKLRSQPPGNDGYTLYIGGGTPSLMPPGQLRRLADGIIEAVGHPPVEFTVECNADDVTPGLAEAWRGCGVNRVSMGVQSLVDSELAVIGRRHDAASAWRAFGTLRHVFDNISLDIIFGLPGQTPASLGTTLRGICSMHPEHVSAYSLMYEEGTPLTVMRDSGRLPETEDGLSADMFEAVCDSLSSEGYVQYEISNYALPGRESRHNSLYWDGSPYIGLGAGAHGYDGMSVRMACRPDAGAFTAVWADQRTGHIPDTATLYDIECLTDTELREEMVFTRLRTRRGLDLREYGRRFGVTELAALSGRARRLTASGLLVIDGDRLKLSRNGIMISDSVIADLL